MRFEVGEMARVVIAIQPSNQGLVTQIIGIVPADGKRWTGPEGKVWYSPQGLRYAIDLPSVSGLAYSFASDWQLAKLDPPAEPVSLTRSKECDHVD